MGSYVNYDDNNIYIYHVDMPYSVTSSVVENEDGSYTIYINSRMSYEKQLEGYEHELRHIMNNDLEYCNDVQKVEMNVRN
nr:MAG TPA: IrrE N-terminal-like domain [Caudoviricetes sp.]